MYEGTAPGCRAVADSRSREGAIEGPVVGLVGQADLLAHLAHRLPLGQGRFCLTQLDEDLIGRKPLRGDPRPSPRILKYSLMNRFPLKGAGQLQR